MSESKTFHAHSRGETDWLQVKVTNTLLTDWTGATFQIGVIHADGTISWSTPDQITVLSRTQTVLASLLGPAGSISTLPAGQYAPTARVTKGSAVFSVDCVGDVIVVD